MSNPVNAPMTIPGAKTPPLPPDPIENDVAIILRKGSMARSIRGGNAITGDMKVSTLLNSTKFSQP